MALIAARSRPSDRSSTSTFVIRRGIRRGEIVDSVRNASSTLMESHPA